MKKTDQKHKTVGVSFNPSLRQRAGVRSRQLGVSFSRYVSLCVEAEIAGALTLPAHPRRRSEALSGQDAPCGAGGSTVLFPGMAVGALAVGPELRLRQRGAMAAGVHRAAAGGYVQIAEDAAAVDTAVDVVRDAAADVAVGATGDTGSLWRTSQAWYGEMISPMDVLLLQSVARVLTATGIGFCTSVCLAGVQTDFLLELRARCGQPERAASADAAEGSTATTRRSAGVAAAVGDVLRVALECRHPQSGDPALLLGRGIMLQQSGAVDAVLLCLPYLTVFERQTRQLFLKQQIGLTTPDTLPASLGQLLAALPERKRKRTLPLAPSGSDLP